MGLKVSPSVAKAIVEGADLGFACDADGAVAGGFETGYSGTPYPPPGYLPWNRMEVGNSDTFGFYWPIGREDEPPIVCTLVHDAGELMPLASSLEAAIQLHLKADDGRDEEWLELAEEFEVEVKRGRKKRGDEDDDDEDEPAEKGIAYWCVKSAAELLPIDPDSPSLLVQRAKELLGTASPDFAAAQGMILKALQILPEYTAAWWQLVQLRRRQKAPAPLLIDPMLNAITSPLAFGHIERQQCLAALQKLDDSADPDCVDPVWTRRKRLTFAQGVKEHDDDEVFREAIEEYHEQGLHLRAVRLRILSGELMGSETVSFRERRSFTWPAYWAALRSDVERAGLHARLIALQHAETGDE
jgi:hypothetical protein